MKLTTSITNTGQQGPWWVGRIYREDNYTLCCVENHTKKMVKRMLQAVKRELLSAGGRKSGR